MKKFSDTTRKNVAAIFVGPLAVIPAILVAGLVSHFLYPEDSAHTDWKEVFSFFSFFAVFFAYVLTVIFATPLVIALQKMNQFTLINVVFTAVFIAGILCLASSRQFLAFLYFSYFTVSVALACWGIHKWA